MALDLSNLPGCSCSKALVCMAESSRSCIPIASSTCGTCLHDQRILQTASPAGVTFGALSAEVTFCSGKKRSRCANHCERW